VGAGAAPDRPKKRVTSPFLPSLQPECSDRMPILGSTYCMSENTPFFISPAY
jgi:hypothetical protein